MTEKRVGRRGGRRRRLYQLEEGAELAFAAGEVADAGGDSPQEAPGEAGQAADSTPSVHSAAAMAPEAAAASGAEAVGPGSGSDGGSGDPMAVASAAASVAGSDSTAGAGGGESSLVARDREALALVNRYSRWSAAAGVVPVPLLDATLIAGVQLAMLRRLAAIYRVPFEEQRAKVVIGALIGGLHGGLVTRGLVRWIPGYGYLAAALPLMVLDAAICFAVGRVFLQHFAAGGTLLDFDPARMRSGFKRYLDEARGEGRA